MVAPVPYARASGKISFLNRQLWCPWRAPYNIARSVQFFQSNDITTFQLSLHLALRTEAKQKACLLTT